MNDAVGRREPARTLPAARGDEARETALSVDLQESYEAIGSRVDTVDRARGVRRAAAVAGHGVAVVAAAAMAVTVLGSPPTPTPPVMTAVPTAPASATPSVAPAPPLSAEITGAWSTSMSRSDVEQTLAEAGLAHQAGRVLQVLGLEADPGLSGYRFQAYVGPGHLWLYRVDEDGTARKIDEHVFDLDGDVLTSKDARVDPPPHVLVLRVALESPSMTLTWIADAGPATVDGLPDEALERVLYTTSTWLRSTT